MDILKERRKRNSERNSGGSAESFGSPRSIVTFKEEIKSKSN
jgi:hypothetical protein